MTKQLSAMAVAMTFGISGVSAMNFTSGMFNFQTDSAPQRCVLVGVAGYIEGDVEIPSTVSFYDEDSNTVEYTVVGIGKEALQGQSEVTTFILPATIETVGSKAFSGCTMLQSVDFPDAVVTIGDMVVEGCYGIRTLNLGSRLEAIGYMAFESASQLERATITAAIPPVLDDEDTFNWQVLSSMILEVPAGSVEAYKNAPYWSEISNIMPAQTAIPERIVTDGVIYSGFTEEAPFTCIATGLDENFTGSDLIIHGEVEAAGKTYRVSGIGESAFMSTTLCTVTIEDGIESIASQAFRGCAEINTVDLPATLKSIGEYAFWGCKGIEKIELPDGMTEIPDWSFAFCGGMKEFIFPKGLKSIGFKAFFQDKGLDGLSLPDGLECISDEAFEECKGLTSIVIPETVNSIGSSAFYQCEQLADVTINASISELPESIFAYSGVRNITFPESLIFIGNNAFEQCNDLVEIYIPSTVTSIGSDTFANCMALSKVSGMENVSEVKNNAFYECESLSDITFSDRLENIGNGVFMRCTSMENIVIPSGKVGQYALLGCSGIKSVLFGDGVTEIGSEAFRDCGKIEEVIADAIVPPALSADAFDAGVYSNATLTVPAESIEAYNTAAGWQKFEDIGTGVESISCPEDPFTVVEGEILITTDKNIAVFTMDGKTVVSGVGMSGRRLVLGKGVYIVRSAGRLVKIML